LNPALPVADIKTVDDLAAASLKARRFALTWFLAFAGAELVLALIGVYGVVSQWTVERWREFGVRIALGARRSDIVSMVMRQGLGAILVGIAIGVAGGALLTCRRAAQRASIRWTSYASTSIDWGILSSYCLGQIFDKGRSRA
jgi:predicted lysophospholipase L1 biosynthesis ABC-type transport system permease subunit